MRVELQKQRGWSSYQPSLITTLCAILFLAFIPKLEGEASGIGAHGIGGGFGEPERHVGRTQGDAEGLRPVKGRRATLEGRRWKTGGTSLIH